MNRYNLIIITFYMSLFAYAFLNMNDSIINNLICIIVCIGSMLLMIKKIRL